METIGRMDPASRIIIIIIVSVVVVNEDSKNHPEIVQFAGFVFPNHEPSKNKKLED
jgi:hypothetical protein